MVSSLAHSSLRNDIGASGNAGVKDDRRKTSLHTSFHALGILQLKSPDLSTPTHCYEHGMHFDSNYVSVC